MPDMTEFSKKDLPAQRLSRLQWQLDAIRANQSDVMHLLMRLWVKDFQAGLRILDGMHKMDRDALLQPNGILTDEQIEAIKNG